MVEYARYTLEAVLMLKMTSGLMNISGLAGPL